MFDIWGFLLQTLTVSGVAVLLLIIKTLLKYIEKWYNKVKVFNHANGGII